MEKGPNGEFDLTHPKFVTLLLTEKLRIPPKLLGVA
jgi:hypothetical protein